MMKKFSATSDYRLKIKTPLGSLTVVLKGSWAPRNVRLILEKTPFTARGFKSTPDIYQMIVGFDLPRETIYRNAKQGDFLALPTLKAYGIVLNDVHLRYPAVLMGRIKSPIQEVKRIIAHGAKVMFEVEPNA